MIVVVTGSRNLQNRIRVIRRLAAAKRYAALELPEPDMYTPPLTIMVGDCPTGADKFATDWAESERGVGLAVFRAEWERLGKAAGPLRNKRMVDTAKDWGRATNRPVYVYTFPKEGAENKGTLGCARMAVDIGISPEYYWGM